MRVERIMTNISTLGPGNRLVIWTNGCNKRCKGCVSKRLQAISNETEMNLIDALEQFNLKKIDGVTISGGEPFIQIDELHQLIKYLKDKNINDILVYTGYTYEELKKQNNLKINDILENIAVLIDGEYIEELNDNKSNIKGSINQKIYIFNQNFKDLYNQYIKNERKMETYIIKNLKIGVGIPDSEYIKKF